MSIYEAMRVEADANFARIGDLLEYPAPEREVELRADVGYFGRVLDGYQTTVADPDPHYRKIAAGRYLPSDVLLLGIVESSVVEGDETAVKERARMPFGTARNQDEFDELAQEATDWVHYGGGPGARLVVPGQAGQWRLYERSQTFAVPELDDNNEPTGQLVGVPSYNVPSRYRTGPKFDPDEVDSSGEGLGKFVDNPGIEEVEAEAGQLGVAPWAGNIIVPKLVAAEVPHIQLTEGVLRTRKIELAWYYLPQGEGPRYDRQRVST